MQITYCGKILFSLFEYDLILDVSLCLDKCFHFSLSTYIFVCQRHYYMRDVNIFIAAPGNSKASLAVSALARAMKEMNKVAIVRCVWRQGQGSVTVGVLTPNISDRDNIVSLKS